METAITFTEGEPYESKWGLVGRAVFTPVYMEKGGGKFHVRNLVEPIKGDCWDKSNADRAARGVDRAKAQLVGNGGAFYCDYSRIEDPIKFIEWIKEQGYTFQVFRSPFEEWEGATHFHGNLVEYSAAFSYWIYDQDLANTLKDMVKDIPQKEF
jgi:hypothetical protein